MSPEDRYQLLFELGSAFAAQRELEELIPLIIGRCRELWSAESAAVLLLDPLTDELYFPYVSGDGGPAAEQLRTLRFPSDRGIAGAVIAGGASEIITDARNDRRFYDAVDETTGISTRSMLVAPLATRRGPIGVIEIVNPKSEEGLSNEDVELLDALAAFMAIAIDNARMFSESREREAMLRSTVVALRRDVARQKTFPEMVGTSPAIAEVSRLMESAATSSISVLVVGETGTGKELVARGIHSASDRAEAPFVAVNCAALPADLLEAELFGHARGAYTGAVADRRGLFEAAHGGSIFLDEIGDLPLSMQVKLLRVLQEGEITPVGTTRPRKVDVRVISATHRDLVAAVEAGEFRADLYYRISAFPILVPPLRQRRTDISQLVDRFLRQASEQQNKQIAGIEHEALAVLNGYAWPGNVRQLKNEIERAVVLTSPGMAIAAATFSPVIRERPDGGEDLGLPPLPPPSVSADLRDARAVFEARFIADQLRTNDGNVSRTAEALGISRVMLQKKMKEYGLRDR